MIFSILVFLFLLMMPKHVNAIYDPMSVSNNKYGIHVADVNDIPDASVLVNSSGGDWGYVTLVIQDNDLNTGKWQEIFNQMRRLHLIPLVRLATRVEGDRWVIPQEYTISKWVDFLSQLNWPIINRYVIIFNEPNHAKEWGGIIDPEGYAGMLVKFSIALKNKSKDFFLLPAGLDASAQNDGEAFDEEKFIKRMFQSQPGVCDSIDGWTSHSYPNPAFAQPPTAFGRGTIRTFIWEKEYLASLGCKKNMPVFITETGWSHNAGKFMDDRLPTSETIGSYLTYSAVHVWQDYSIAAVTPFLFNYQDYPFDHFSWKQFGSQQFYFHYDSYRNIPKVRGKPKQYEIFSFTQPLLPHSLIADSTYTLFSDIVNTGQSILNHDDGYEWDIDEPSGTFSFYTQQVPFIEPRNTKRISLSVKTPVPPGTYPVTIAIRHNGIRIPIEKYTVELVPPALLTLKTTLGWKKESSTHESTVILFDSSNAVIHKISGTTLEGGKLTIRDLRHIIPGKKYRIVLLVPYYLPRQEIVEIEEKETIVAMKRLLPIDYNRDGALTIADFYFLFLTKPHTVLSRFF